MRIGLLHPGEMGSAVGLSLVEAGHEVLWAGEGRSPETAERARGFTDVGTVAALVGEVEWILSLCPPQAAGEVLRSSVDAGFTGTFVESNALSPREVRAMEKGAGGRLALVDGAVVGPPPRRSGTTRIYLSGEKAADAAGWLSESLLEPVVVGSEVGSASAVKMCVEAWRKGSAALLAGSLAAAEGWDVSELVLTELEARSAGTRAFAESETSRIAPKGWRFNAEMRAAADTFEDVGIPSGALHGAAEVYDRLATFKGLPEPPTEEVLRTLLNPES